MYVYRAYKQSMQRLQDRELPIELTRQFMTLFANANRDTKKKPTPYTPQDFWKLSYDTQLTQEADPELFGRIARRLGSTIKKKNSGDK